MDETNSEEEKSTNIEWVSHVTTVSSFQQVEKDLRFKHDGQLSFEIVWTFNPHRSISMIQDLMMGNNLQQRYRQKRMITNVKYKITYYANLGVSKNLK